MILRIIDSFVMKFIKKFSRKNLYTGMKEQLKKELKKDKKTILNIGSGGEVAEIIKKFNFNLIQIDIDIKRNPDFVLSIENMNKIKDNSIDIICCMEVLEHVENPWKGIEECHRVLKKGARFIGSTPFIFPIHDEPYDFYRYTKFGIKKIFHKFNSLKIKERNSYFESVNVLVLRSYFNKQKYEKIIFLILIPLFLVSLIPMFILSHLFKLKNATTGYFFTCKK